MFNIFRGNFFVLRFVNSKNCIFVPTLKIKVSNRLSLKLENDRLAIFCLSIALKSIVLEFLAIDN